MFVVDEVLLDVGYVTAREGLTRLAQGSVLLSASQDAYGRSTEGLARVGPTAVSKLVRVQVCDLAETEHGAGVAIRWEAAGAAGGLFPVMDADLRLSAIDESHTLLTLSGAYRPPLGMVGKALDRAVLHRVAAATVRRFISRLAADICAQVEQAAAADPEPRPAASPPAATADPRCTQDSS